MFIKRLIKAKDRRKRNVHTVLNCFGGRKTSKNILSLNMKKLPLINVISAPKVLDICPNSTTIKNKFIKESNVKTAGKMFAMHLCLKGIEPQYMELLKS